jgi:hypothetical protein
MNTIYKCKTVKDVIEVLNIKNVKHYDIIKDVVLINMHNEPYRLSDIYRNIKSAIKSVLSEPKHDRTIGYKYASCIKVSGIENSDKLFKSIVKQNVKYSKPKVNEIVIALRLSDKPNSIKDTFDKSINKILDICGDIDSKKITIMIGLHYPSLDVMNEESLISDIRTLDNIISVFVKHRYKVSIRSNRNPDKDFYYMCHANFFISTESGFGALAGFFNETESKWIVNSTRSTNRLFLGGYDYTCGIHRRQPIRKKTRSTKLLY